MGRCSESDDLLEKAFRCVSRGPLTPPNGDVEAGRPLFKTVDVPGRLSLWLFHGQWKQKPERPAGSSRDGGGSCRQGRGGGEPAPGTGHPTTPRQSPAAPVAVGLRLRNERPLARAAFRHLSLCLAASSPSFLRFLHQFIHPPIHPPVFRYISASPSILCPLIFCHLSVSLSIHPTHRLSISIHLSVHLSFLLVSVYVC